MRERDNREAGRRGDRQGEGYEAWHRRAARTHFSFGGPNEKCLPGSEHSFSGQAAEALPQCLRMEIDQEPDAEVRKF